VKRRIWLIVAFFALAPFSLDAQGSSQSSSDKTDESDRFVREHQGPSVSTEKSGSRRSENPCARVATLGAVIDGAFDGKRDEMRMVQPLLSDVDDEIWDELSDCANQTHKASERSEALRVSAFWERLRSEEFQKLYRDSVPVSAPACGDLERMYRIVKAAKYQNDASSKPDSGGAAVRKNLVDCANDSYRLNQGHPRSQETDAAEYLSIWTARNQDYLIARYNGLASDHSQLLESANDLVGKYNALLDDSEKERSIAMQAINANDSSVKSLERMVLFQSMQVRSMTCGGSSYSYGKWGTFNFECH
jgi:hypothetical protein